MWAASGRVHPEAGPVGGSGLARAGLCPPAPDQHPPPSSLSLKMFLMTQSEKTLKYRITLSPS